MKSFEINLPFKFLPAKHWGYEQAFAADYITDADWREGGETVDRLHQQFADAFDVNPDNKETYGVICNALFHIPR